MKRRGNHRPERPSGTHPEVGSVPSSSEDDYRKADSVAKDSLQPTERIARRTLPLPTCHESLRTFSSISWVTIAVTVLIQVITAKLM